MGTTATATPRYSAAPTAPAGLEPTTRQFIDGLDGAPPLYTLRPETAHRVLTDPPSRPVPLRAADVTDTTWPIGPTAETRIREADSAEDAARVGARRGASHRATSPAAWTSRTFRRAAAALAFAALGAGCDDDDSPGDPWTVPSGARLVSTSAVIDGTGSPPANYSGIETAEQGVVRDSAAWAALWERIVTPGSPPQPLPAVNFSRDMVVYAALGRQSTGGHSVAVAPVYEAGGAYYPVVTELRRGAGCATLPALTAPVSLVRVPRWSGDVRFVKRTGTIRCE